MNVKYRVDLSQGEREELTAWSRAGKIAARRLKRIQILLAAAADTDDETIASSIGVGGSTVYRTKRRFVEDGLDAALSEEPRPGAARKLSGRDEALLVATACSKPPPPASRGREGLSPSPPSEPCGRFSRTRLSSWWFPHRGLRAARQAVSRANSPAVAK